MDQDDDALAQAHCTLARRKRTSWTQHYLPVTMSRSRSRARPSEQELPRQQLAPSELPSSELSTFHAEEGWRPNTEHLQLIMSMASARTRATRALYYTGKYEPRRGVGMGVRKTSKIRSSTTVPPSAAHPTRLRPLPDLSGESGFGTWTTRLLGETSSFKMAFVVNTELKMGCGKTAAQVALWEEECGSKKIVLKGRSASHLSELAEKAESLGVPTMAIRDAGRTQVDPGALTVIALFGRNVDVDGVTGHLKLM
eukprot:Em0011g805a